MKEDFKLFHDLERVDLLDIFLLQVVRKNLFCIEMFQFQHSWNRIEIDIGNRSSGFSISVKKKIFGDCEAFFRTGYISSDNHGLGEVCKSLHLFVNASGYFSFHCFCKLIWKGCYQERSKIFIIELSDCKSL